MRVLGISAFYHDSAAAVVLDGEVIGAAQEERFTRRKHDPGFPAHAVEYCLREAGVSLDAFDCIAEFERLTGCAVIVNTSFNVQGEPIVCTPADAFRCFMGTEIEVLAVGNCYLSKDRQDPSLLQKYEENFDLD